MFRVSFHSQEQARRDRLSFRPTLERLEERRLLSGTPADPCVRVPSDYAEALAGVVALVGGLAAPAPVPVKAGLVLGGVVLIADGLSKAQADSVACATQRLNNQLNNLLTQASPTMQVASLTSPANSDPDNDGDTDIY